MSAYLFENAFIHFGAGAGPFLTLSTVTRAHDGCHQVRIHGAWRKIRTDERRRFAIFQRERVRVQLREAFHG